MKIAVALLLAIAPLASQEGDPAKVVAALQEAIRKNPEVESNYTNLGNLLLRTQNFPEAAMVLEATRKRFPQSAQAAVSLGVAYYGQRRFSDAVATFLEASHLDRDAEQPIAFLNRMSEHWGDRKAEVIDLFAGFANGHPQSALAHLALGRAKSNAAELRRAIALNPRMADAHFELGIVLESQKDFPNAIAAFQKSAQLSPRNPTPHYRLFRVYSRTGDTAKAETERTLHEKLSAEETAELDRRQSATKHMEMKVR